MKPINKVVAFQLLKQLFTIVSLPKSSFYIQFDYQKNDKGIYCWLVLIKNNERYRLLIIFFLSDN